MAIPILMLGPGGNYTTRYEAASAGRMRQVRGAQGHPDHADTESNYSFAGYGGRRQRGREDQGGEPSADGKPDRRADRFEHTPATDLPVERRGGRRWVKTGSLNAAAQAIAAWIEQQQSTLTQVKMTLMSFTPPAEPAAEN